MSILGEKIPLGIAAILLIVLFTSCNKDKVESLQTDFDVNGFWIVLDESTSTCSGDLETEKNTLIYSVEQSGAYLKIKVYPNEDIINGQLDDNILTWSGTIPTVSGNLDIDFSGTVSSEGKTINGQGGWKWYDDSYNCSGTSRISGEKVDAEDMDFSGNWNGFWESEEYGLEGAFSATVTQNGNSLSGSISVADLGMENIALSGMVHGNVVYFGDVDGVIKFAGTISEDLSTGDYSYNSLSDEGSWTAARGSDAGLKKLLIADKFSIETGCADMAYDGENFYLLSQLEIVCINKSGSTLFKYPTPGNYPDGLAFNGEYLLIGDNAWGTNRIYKLAPSAINIMDLPEGGDVVGVIADGKDFWFGTGGFGDFSIVKTNADGTETQSISFSGRHFHGLASDDNTIWISYEDSKMFPTTILAKLNQEGAILDSFHLEDGLNGRLAFDGENIWMAAGSDLYAFDEKGDVEKTLSIQGAGSTGEIAGFTFDGDNFWCVTSGDFVEPGKIFSVDPESGIVGSSFESPGSSSVGLAYDGMYLRLADRITHRLYTLPKSGDYYLPYPSFDIASLCADEDLLYAYNSSDEEMVILNSSGDEADNFSILLDWSGNFFFDGEYYWSAENFLDELKRIIKFNNQGKIIAYYQPGESIPSIASLIIDGNDIWCVASSNEDTSQLIRLQLEGEE